MMCRNRSVSADDADSIRSIEVCANEFPAAGGQDDQFHRRMMASKPYSTAEWTSLPSFPLFEIISPPL